MLAMRIFPNNSRLRPASLIFITLITSINTDGFNWTIIFSPSWETRFQNNILSHRVNYNRTVSCQYTQQNWELQLCGPKEISRSPPAHPRPERPCSSTKVFHNALSCNTRITVAWHLLKSDTEILRRERTQGPNRVDIYLPGQRWANQQPIDCYFNANYLCFDKEYPAKDPFHRPFRQASIHPYKSATVVTCNYCLPSTYI